MWSFALFAGPVFAGPYAIKLGFVVFPCLRLVTLEFQSRHPLFFYALLYATVVVFKHYPTAGDVAVYLPLLLMHSDVVRSPRLLFGMPKHLIIARTSIWVPYHTILRCRCPTDRRILEFVDCHRYWKCKFFLGSESFCQRGSGLRDTILNSHSRCFQVWLLLDSLWAGIRSLHDLKVSRQLLANVSGQQ